MFIQLSVEILVKKCNFTDNFILSIINYASELEKFEITNCSHLTPASLVHVNRAKQLKILKLTALGDDGNDFDLNDLACLNQLEVLQIADNKMEFEGPGK